VLARRVEQQKKSKDVKREPPKPFPVYKLLTRGALK